MNETYDSSLEALKEIKSIMDRSARFVSLAGMSGVWAGTVALVSASVAYVWLQKPEFQHIGKAMEGTMEFFDPFTIKLMLLGIATFVFAFAGALYFTWKKAKSARGTLWNNASRQMVLHGFYPLFAGGMFSIMFIYYGCGLFVVPACLIFYGLALISASRHTYSDIRYIGMLDVVLGCTSLFFPGFGLYFWALGFGVLHIVYGLIMWNRYDKWLTNE
ncbi:MAG: hypothetical protein EBZ77_04135 [Chitinophagia bacterium]|nr:hypothetical protein [Chitinophagia bacterium]